VKSLISKFVRDDRGMETVEWAVLAALIVAALVGIIAALGGNVKTAFTKLQNATNGSGT
jgi:Flp pilus assembly pilin Flp